MPETYGSMIGKKITDESSLVNWVKEIAEREKVRVRGTWQAWLTNLAAFHGRPDLVLTSDLRVIRRLSARQRKQIDEISCNFVAPHVRTIAAKLQKGRPLLECLPSTSDEDDIQAAKVGDALLKCEWKEQQMDLVRLEMAMWMCSTGNGFLHQYFNSSAGPVNMGVPIGKIETKTLNPFKVSFEPNRTRVDHARWCLIRELLPIDQIIEQYGGSYSQRNGGRELQISPNSGTISGTGDAVVDSYLQSLNITETHSQSISEFSEVTTLYHMPTAWYPQGIYAIIADDKVLYWGPYPYAFLGRLPILHFREILAPWKLYGDTSATDVVKSQDNYIRLRKIERDYHLDNLSSKWFKPKGCRVPNEKLTSRESLIIEYNAANGAPPPHREPGLNVPGSIFASINLAREEIDRSSGLNDVSRGGAQVGGSSGRAILALQEQDDTRLGLTVQLNEAEWTKWGQNTLLMAKEFYQEKRKYHMAGKSKEGAVMFFDRASLASTNDVHCVPGSAMPQNKLAKQETIMNMFTGGLLGDPSDPQVAARTRKMLEFGQAEEIVDYAAVHENVAERENLAMVMTGQVMAVERYDDDVTHLRIHEIRANEAGVRDNPMMYQVIAQHMDMHKMALAMKQNGAPGPITQNGQLAIPQGASLPGTPNSTNVYPVSPAFGGGVPHGAPVPQQPVVQPNRTPAAISGSPQGISVNDIARGG